jgi:RimJ/RimL family protein N-acetyltransferase
MAPSKHRQHMLADADDYELLKIEVATGFVMSDSGQMLYENAPDRLAAPRLYLAGCTSGNIMRLRHDVGDETAHAIEMFSGNEPLLASPDSTPVYLNDYIRLLGAESPVKRWEAGLTWTFPTRLAYEHKETVVASETAQGDRLIARIVAEGMPQGLAEMGFAGVDDFWKPWCAALYGDEVASIAFSARLGPAGAETGVVTVPALRGRGYAAAATAGWASLPPLRGRALFYSTDRTNISSQRVAERLGLHFLGASISIM